MKQPEYKIYKHIYTAIYNKLVPRLDRCKYTEKIDDVLDHYDICLSIKKMFESEKDYIDKLIEHLAQTIMSEFKQ